MKEVKMGIGRIEASGDRSAVYIQMTWGYLVNLYVMKDVSLRFEKEGFWRCYANENNVRVLRGEEGSAYKVIVAGRLLMHVSELSTLGLCQMKWVKMEENA